MKSVFDQFSMAGKIVIVTGGAGLLGSQFCIALAQAGAKVILADKTSKRAEKIISELADPELSLEYCFLDVTAPETIKAMVSHVYQRFGKIDVLVNAAAIDPKFDLQGNNLNLETNFEDYPLEAWKLSLDINLTGVFLTTQAVAKQMVKQCNGVIINICSTYGLAGPDQRIYPLVNGVRRYKPIDYSVSKAGILGMTRYLASYYAGKGIRVNALSPGGIYNEHPEEFEKNYSARTILGRMAEKDEMNGALLFLASEASSYMTGSNLIVDGGWTAW